MSKKLRLMLPGNSKKARPVTGTEGGLIKIIGNLRVKSDLIPEKIDETRKILFYCSDLFFNEA
jgi:hypothetical protein